MEVKQININNNIHLLSFQNHEDLVYTFLRFQEHYESPHFRGKVFSLDEYIQRYIKNSTGGQETGKFTYCEDRTGFSIPSPALSAFYKGSFNPLSIRERRLLSKFAKKKDDNLFIIGISSNTYDVDNTLKHEVVHGLFYSDPQYKKEVLGVLAGFNFEEVEKELCGIGLYHKDVFLDEINAYIVDGDYDPDNKVLSDISIELQGLYNKYSKINNIILPPIL